MANVIFNTASGFYVLTFPDGRKGNFGTLDEIAVMCDERGFTFTYSGRV